MTLIEAFENAENNKPLEFDDIRFESLVRNAIEERTREVVELENGQKKIKYGTLQKFCNRHNFNRSNISKWLNGHKDIELKTFIRLCQIAKIEMKLNERDIIYNRQNIVSHQYEVDCDETGKKRLFKF